MNRLPIETVTEIVSNLKALLAQDLPPYYTPKLSAYSTINKTWQAVIERHTFRTIGITTDGLPMLKSLLSGPTGTHRIRSIRELDFDYLRDQVPVLTPTQHAELREQQRLANESFSENMRVLFAMLRGWEERLDADGGVVWDTYQLRLILGTDYRDESRQPRIDVRYVGGEELPELGIVSEVVPSEGHKIHPETLMRILSRMRCMDYFGGFIWEENNILEITKEYRKVLAQCLHLLPRSVTRFGPRFYPCEFDPQATYSVLLDPLRDHLCLSIRALSSRFRTLHLRDFRLSTAIFEGDGDGSYPDWSGLEELHISYPVMSSTGQWFATAAPPEPVTQDDPNYYGDRPIYYGDRPIYFSLPNPALLNELYAAVGRARQHMPALKSLKLTLEVHSGEHNFKYGFDSQLKRVGVFLDSSIPFGFSSEVAEAWGFGLGDVKTFEAKVTLYKVLL